MIFSLCSVLASETCGDDLEIKFATAHVAGLLNHDATLDVYIRASSFLLQSYSLVDAIGPVDSQTGDDALTSASVFKEPLVSAIVAYICHDVVHDDDHEVEVPGELLEELCVSQHEL